MTFLPTSAAFAQSSQPRWGCDSQRIVALDAAVGHNRNELAALAVEAVEFAEIGNVDLHLLDGEVRQVGRLHSHRLRCGAKGSASAANPEAAVRAAPTEALRNSRRDGFLFKMYFLLSQRR